MRFSQQRKIESNNTQKNKGDHLIPFSISKKREDSKKIGEKEPREGSAYLSRNLLLIFCQKIKQ